ncbi:MAG: hypothetical protein DRP09_18690 [Candidatus Thorarchaeota archaeon]|nr:MAG: hypothetical protein DRP09_18690 [Candidatus Thorarchaeota archaeon]
MAIKTVVRATEDQWPELVLQRVLIVAPVANQKANANVGFLVKTMAGYVRAWARPDVPVIGGPDEVLTVKDLVNRLDGRYAVRALADLEFGDKDGVVFLNLIKWVDTVDI